MSVIFDALQKAQKKDQLVSNDSMVNVAHVPMSGYQPINKPLILSILGICIPIIGLLVCLIIMNMNKSVEHTKESGEFRSMNHENTGSYQVIHSTRDKYAPTQAAMYNSYLSNQAEQKSYQAVDRSTHDSISGLISGIHKELSTTIVDESVNEVEYIKKTRQDKLNEPIEKRSTYSTLQAKLQSDYARYEGLKLASGKAVLNDDALGWEKLPTYNDIVKEQGDILTSLGVTMHLYSRVPVKRSVVIDGVAYREGDQISKNTHLEKITKQGVIINSNGFYYRQSIQPDL